MMNSEHIDTPRNKPLSSLRNAIGAFELARERLEQEYLAACDTAGLILQPEQIGPTGEAAADYLFVLYDRAVDFQERSMRPGL